MRNRIIVIAIMALFVLPVSVLAGPGCGKDKPCPSKKTVSAVCPVMGTKIPDVSKASGKSVHKGKTYYFCCPGCKPQFDKNPEKYTKKAPKK